MTPFIYKNPTELFFGAGQIAAIAQAIPSDKKIIILYGGGSIKRNGVLAQVKKALSGREFTEFGGIEPNPEYSTLMRAVEQIRQNGANFLLAVGGGSVVDGSKFIAAACCYTEGEPWDILAKQKPVMAALPLACVITLPATGSESNDVSVISNKANNAKMVFKSPLIYPLFAVLDPSTTYSLPQKQVANGIVDAFIHVIEQYLTIPANAMLQDRYAESLLQTLIAVAPQTLQKPTDYDARANFMWAANQAFNGLIASGVPQDWSSHVIGHEITALYGLDHAQSIAAVLPHNLRARKQLKRAKLLQYANRVWQIDNSFGNEDLIIETAISRTEEFFQSTGLACKLSQLGIEATAADKVAARLEKSGNVKLGEAGDVTPDLVRQILQASLR